MKTLRLEPLALPFLALIVVLLFGAAQYANNLGFFFAFWLSALAVGSLIGLRSRLDRVRNQVRQIDSGFANTSLAVQLDLYEAQGLWLSMSLASKENDPISPATHITQASQSIALPQRPRGVFPVGNLRLVIRDHIGLLSVERSLPLTGKYWVYPAPLGDRPLPAMARPNTSQGQDDFHGLRNYQAGDNPARIHWKSLAKSSPQQPMLRVKQFGSDTSAEPTPHLLDEALLLDMPLEARLSQLTAWILHCEHQGEPYALRLLDRAATPPGLGESHRLHCLRLLAEAS